MWYLVWMVGLSMAILFSVVHAIWLDAKIPD